RARLERLPGYQIELVYERRRRSGDALGNLPADGVEPGIDTETRGALDNDRDRQRGQWRVVGQPDLFLIEKRAIGADYRRNGDVGVSHVDGERGDARHSPATPRDNHIDRACRNRAWDCDSGNAAVPGSGRRIERDSDAIVQDDCRHRFKSVQRYAAREPADARYRDSGRRACATIDRQARRVDG